jgi:hypothetical protein
MNQQHFVNYPYTVEYQYNSRGFRDAEWPVDAHELKKSIWCIGDSFTVGIGSPYEFTWPQVLSQQAGQRCINVSMDGASNNWISRRAGQIIKEISPANLVILWSYFHRRESNDSTLIDEQRRMFNEKFNSESDDLDNFIRCYSAVNQLAVTTKVIHGVIPNAGLTLELNSSWKNIRDPSWPEQLPKTREDFDQLPQHIKKETLNEFSKFKLDAYFKYNNFCKQNQLIELDNLDYARDHHHFDKITSEFFVNSITKNFNNQLKH